MNMFSQKQCFLNNRPVFVGTKLQYKKDWVEASDNSLNSVVVTSVSHVGIDYEGIGVEGNIYFKELENVFQHYDDPEATDDNLYEIERISDLLDLSPEKLERFLKDLPLALHATNVARIAIVEEFERRHGCKLEGQDLRLFTRMTLPNILWHDDGERTVDVSIGGTPAMSVSVTTPDSTK